MNQLGRSPAVIRPDESVTLSLKSVSDGDSLSSDWGRLVLRMTYLCLRGRSHYWALAASCMLIVAGCGYGDSTPRRGPSAPAGIALDGEGANPPPNRAAQAPAPAQPAAPPQDATSDQPVETPAPGTDTAVQPRDRRLSLPRLGAGNNGKAEEEPPARPEDLDKWRPEDFRSARAEGDAKLVEAVERLGERAQGSDKAAAMFVELLMPPPEEPPPEDESKNRRQNIYNTRRSVQTPRNLVPTIIEALGKNGTSGSRMALLGIISGQLPIDSTDRNLQSKAIEALVEDENPEAENLLFMILTAVEPPVAAEGEEKDNRRDTSVEQNRNTVLDLLQNKRAPQLRMRLADVALNPATPADQREAFMAFLMSPDADNLPAQKKIYLDPSTQAPERTALAEQFIDYSVTSINELLGIPPEANPRGNRLGGGITSRFGGSRPVFNPRRRGGRGAVTKEPDPDQAYRIAEQLWSPDLVDSINGRLEALHDLDEDGVTMMLAWELPVHSVRQRLYDLLKEHWDEGTKDIKAGSRFGQDIHDPGLILVAKSAPRKTDPSKIKKPERESSHRRNRPSYRRRSTNNTNNDAADRDKARYEWMDASEQFLRVLNDRFYAAAQAQGGANGSQRIGAEGAAPVEGSAEKGAIDASSEEPRVTAKKSALRKPHELPFHLHPKSEPVAEYHLTWPNDVQGKISGVEITPLIIHYVRVEETNRLGTVRAFYNRQFAKYGREREINDGYWLDVVEPGTNPDWRRSTDVLITQTDPDDGDEESKRRRRTEGEPLVIEILSVEIPDPRRLSTSSENASDEER